MMAVVAQWLGFAAFLFFATKRLPRYLHIFQQEEYDGRRFMQWLVRTRAFDRQVSLALLVAGVIVLFMREPNGGWFAGAMSTAAFLAFALREPDPRLEAKKKLVMTDRAKRIFTVTLALCLVPGIIALRGGTPFGWIIVTQALPVLLALANLLLSPFESAVQRRIMDEARARLREIDPAVIGITGSFGKTSVKHILGHVLEMNAPTLYTPGSVNTLMGVSRIIRESLMPDCKFFLVEMGAYGEGSIKKLCGLTPPAFGIITALGEAHYERFKTLDTVARAKFELAEEVLKQQQGRIVLHESVLDQPYARDFVQRHPGRFIICGAGASADVRIEGIEQTTSGLSVRIRDKGTELTLFAPLFGLHHAGNIVLAYAAAVALGVPSDRAAAALRSAPQIRHRLEVKPQVDGTVQIDDAFNSNPQGFVSAIDFMARLAKEKGERANLVTPG
jgi:UDP-N-acetylmuramoyl-tripeptide--D-alanyl-D-alanine ligase